MVSLVLSKNIITATKVASVKACVLKGSENKKKRGNERMIESPYGEKSKGVNGMLAYQISLFPQ